MLGRVRNLMLEGGRRTTGPTASLAPHLGRYDEGVAAPGVAGAAG